MLFLLPWQPGKPVLRRRSQQTERAKNTEEYMRTAAWEEWSGPTLGCVSDK